MSCVRNCNQGRACPARSATGRSCDELGVCQHRAGCAAPPGAGGRLAPGVIDGPHRARPQQLPVSGRRIAIALYALASAAALAAALGFATGYLHLPGMLP